MTRQDPDSPVVLCSFDQIVNLGVDELKNSFFSRFFASSKLFCGFEDDSTAY